MELLTIEEATRRLRISRATLYRWSREGRLKLYRLSPRASRVRCEDVERLELEATPVHDREFSLVEEAALHDAWANLQAIEAELPPGHLEDYLEAIKADSTPVRWNAETEEFDEI